MVDQTCPRFGFLPLLKLWIQNQNSELTRLADWCQRGRRRPARVGAVIDNQLGVLGHSCGFHAWKKSRLSLSLSHLPSCQEATSDQLQLPQIHTGTEAVVPDKPERPSCRICSRHLHDLLPHRKAPRYAAPEGEKRSYEQDGCVACQDDRYQPKPNHSKTCLKCSVCNKNKGSEEVSPCTRKSNAVCKCLPGFVSRDSNNETCTCEKGYEMEAKEKSCVPCKDGFYSTDGEKCIKWTECGTKQVRVEGSREADVVCGDDPSAPKSSPGTPVPGFSGQSHSTYISAVSASTTPARSATTPRAGAASDFKLGKSSPFLPPASAPALRPPTLTSAVSLPPTTGLMLAFFISSLVLLVIVITTSCKLVIWPCIKKKKKLFINPDGSCRRPVEESGDSSRSSLVPETASSVACAPQAHVKVQNQQLFACVPVRVPFLNSALLVLDRHYREPSQAHASAKESAPSTGVPETASSVACAPQAHVKVQNQQLFACVPVRVPFLNSALLVLDRHYREPSQAHASAKESAPSTGVAQLKRRDEALRSRLPAVPRARHARSAQPRRGIDHNPFGRGRQLTGGSDRHNLRACCSLGVGTEVRDTLPPNPTEQIVSLPPIPRVWNVGEGERKCNTTEWELKHERGGPAQEQLRERPATVPVCRSISLSALLPGQLQGFPGCRRFALEQSVLSCSRKWLGAERPACCPPGGEILRGHCATEQLRKKKTRVNSFIRKTPKHDVTVETTFKESHSGRGCFSAAQMALTLRLSAAACLLLLALQLPLSVELRCSLERQYTHRDRCCDMCPPGHYLKKECSKSEETVCNPCEQGKYSYTWDINKECLSCRVCSQGKCLPWLVSPVEVVVRQCNSTADAVCGCREGYSCTSETCEQCVRTKRCGRGQELRTHGSFEFRYECENCTSGTYSDTEGGPCKPWTECHSIGLQTVSPGNHTHNVKCTSQVVASFPQLLTVLVIVCALFGLIFTVIFTNVCIWRAKFRRQKSLIRSTVTHPLDLGTLLEEPSICPLSEEERGDWPVQENSAKPSLPGKPELERRSENLGGGKRGPVCWQPCPVSRVQSSASRTHQRGSGPVPPPGLVLITGLALTAPSNAVKDTAGETAETHPS
ncbi:TNR11 factor, partial [Atractosteus spatula]|nr:TNR11 factor [Atractosteus spatula]